MENLEAYKNQIEEVQNLVNRLENGDLSKEDLTKLESLTRMIHERSIILKYVAFGGVSPERKPENENSTAEVEKEEAPISFEIPKEEKVEIDLFGDFEKKEEEVETPLSIAEILEDIQKEEPNFVTDTVEKEIDSTVEEKIEKETPVVEEEESVISENKTFIDQLNLDDNSLHSVMSASKIETLVGAFSLNEKLRFMNDLFDGSSDDFNESVKILDQLENGLRANDKINELARNFEWETEDEAVVEFISFINRRYA